MNKGIFGPTSTCPRKPGMYELASGLVKCIDIMVKILQEGTRVTWDIKATLT